MKVAVIPARGGSKRILGKNIRSFAGKPIIGHAIECALKSKLFDRVIVSTDDRSIADVSVAYGAEVPFERPQALSDDLADTDSVLLHALMAPALSSLPIKYACCIYPTTPFLKVHDLEEALDLLVKRSVCSVFPLVEYDFPIQQAFRRVGERPVAAWPEMMSERSQDLERHFHDAALFYWVDAEKFLAVRKIFGEDSATIVVPSSRCQDINTEEDWERAELKFQILQGIDVKTK